MAVHAETLALAIESLHSDRNVDLAYLAATGCGRKEEPPAPQQEAKPKPAAAFTPGVVNDALYVEFFAHYRIANALLRKEAEQKAGKQTPHEIQKQHLAELAKKRQALEKRLGVTKEELEKYISKKKAESSDYWVKMIHPKLQKRTSELEEKMGVTQ